VLKYALYLEHRRAQTRAIDKRESSAQSAGTLRCEDAGRELFIITRWGAKMCRRAIESIGIQLLRPA
jgi:hypothetical protein